MTHTNQPATRSLVPRWLHSSWVLDCGLALLLTLWYYRFGIRRLDSVLYDTFDQKQLIYNLEWMYHSLFGTGSVAHLFDLNAFYPNQNSLAWSDTLIGFLPVYSVFKSITSNAHLAFNLTAIAFVISANLGFMRIGRELGGRTSIIAAAVGGIGLLPASMEGHFQFKAVALVIWALFFLLKFVRGSGVALAISIAFACWTLLCSIYYAIMLAVVVVSAIFFACIIGRSSFVSWVRTSFRQVPWKTLVGVVGVSFLPVAWVGAHYAQVRSQFGGGYDLSEFRAYSARFGSVFDAPPTSLIYRNVYSDWGSHESRMCFGMLVWGAIVLLAATWKRWTAPEHDKWFVRFFGFASILSIVLAFGPYERYSLEHNIQLPLPAWLYAKFFPGFTVLRTIGRFAVFGSIFVAVLSELGVRRSLDALGLSPRRSKLTYAGLATLVVLEQSTVLRPTPVELIPRRAVYEAIRDRTPADAVVVELPITRNGHIETISAWHEQMLGSTIHWRRIPIGWTSLEPESMGRLKSYWEEYQGGRSTPSEVISKLTEFGITHFVVDTAQLDPAIVADLRQEFMRRGTPEIGVSAGVSIFGPRATR